jgi:macrolide transport system ATP-binding/permease protein
MDTFWQDVRYAARMLLKKPGFTAVAVFSLTLGIGANTSMFTLLNALFLHSIPVQDPTHTIIMFGNQHLADGTTRDYLAISYPNAQDIQENDTAFSSLARVWFTGANLDVSGKPVGVGTELVDWNFFDIMGMHAALGRTFSPEEDQTPGARPVVILSNALWKRQFGADPGILGKTIRINSVDYNVVGVAPPEFRNLGWFGSPDLWVPMMMHIQVVTDATKDWYLTRAPRMIYLVGRLKPGVSLRSAQQASSVIWDQLARAYPKDDGAKGLTLLPISETNIPPQVRSVFVLAGTMLTVIVGFVLLIACGNVANLLLARATQRRRELAVRQSLGASRARLLRQLLTESLLLGLFSGAFGIVLAFWGRNAMRAYLPANVIQNLDLQIDMRVLLYALGISLLASLVFGLLPAFRASNSDQMVALRDRTDAPSSAGRWYGLRGVLVMVQVALSLVALAGAGLFIHSLRNAQTMDPGFEVNHELVAFLNFGQQHYSQAQAEEDHRLIAERVRALPMVLAAGFADTAPLSPNVANTLFPDGVDTNDPHNAKLVPVTSAQPGYFQALNVPILEGRDFTEQDDAKGAKVVVINQAMADNMWPGRDPLGKRVSFLILPDKYVVVGVVKTVKYITLGEPPQPVLYFPMKQQYRSSAWLHVRVAGDPIAAKKAISAAITSVDPNLRLPRMQTARELIDNTLQPQVVEAELLAGFGILALLLAAIGTYGVMSYTVGQRTQEIGIRMALGAEPRDVMRLMLGGGMAMVGGGVVAALIVTLLLTHSLNSLLYGIGVFDPLSFFVMAALMIAVALIACSIPSRRAMRVNPMIALRYE